MKKLLLLFRYLSFFTFLLCAFYAHSQVGIGTTSPNASSILDIDDVTGTKGLLIPRVALLATTNSAPILPAPATSLLIYNTATASTGSTAVFPGYYYWSGTRWMAIAGTEKWDLLGNIGTNQATNFIGTTDAQGLTFRTNNLQRFRIANGNQVLAMANGSAAAPFYSWDADKTMGFWRSGTRQLDMVINGSTFFNANANTAAGSDLELSINPAGVDMNLRVETDNNANSLFVSGEDDNIGFGTNAPNPSSQLDMAAINRGLLINRVTLTSTTNAAPMTTPATGLLVYNTATNGVGSLSVKPGFYYWNSIKWVAMDGTNGKDWSLEGNFGTNPTSNFLGTVDNEDLVFRTNNAERMRFLNSGNAAIGNSPFTNVSLRVNNNLNEFGILSQTNSVAGNAILGLETGAGDAISGQSSGTGSGVFGSASGSGVGVAGMAVNNHGVLGQSNYTGGSFLTAGTVGIGSGANNANGMLAATLNAATTQANIAFRAIGGGTTSFSNVAYRNVGVNTNGKDLGLYSITEGPIFNGSINRNYDAAVFTTNYEGPVVDVIPDARDPQARLAGYAGAVATPLGVNNVFYGAYLYSGAIAVNASYAYAGARIGSTNYKIIGNGTVSTIVNGGNAGSKKIMFAPEAPEVLFEDYGTAQLNNGQAQITIDPIFANNIVVNQQHPLKVFIQLEGDCNGVYVTNKSGYAFTVKELQNGTSNVPFSWHIVANRKDEIGRSTAESSMYSNLRFPEAPNAIAAQGNKATEFENPILKSKTISFGNKQ